MRTDGFHSWSDLQRFAAICSPVSVTEQSYTLPTIPYSDSSRSITREPQLRTSSKPRARSAWAHCHGSVHGAELLARNSRKVPTNAHKPGTPPLRRISENIAVCFPMLPVGEPPAWVLRCAKALITTDGVHGHREERILRSHTGLDEAQARTERVVACCIVIRNETTQTRCDINMSG